MKFPQLFGRTPSHRRFEYKPRFYDPQKEEREDRERRIREELALEKNESDETANLGDYRSRMKGTFHRNRRRSKPTGETNPVLVRLAVLLFITVFLIAYLTWGNVAFYGVLLFFPVWIYFRFIRNS